MIQHQGLLPYLEKLGVDASAANALGFTHPADPSIYIFYQKYILLIIQTADAFVKNGNKPAPFHSNFIYSDARAFLGELHVCYLEQDQNSFLTFALFLDLTIQQIKVRSDLIMSLFTSTLLPID